MKTKVRRKRTSNLRNYEEKSGCSSQYGCRLVSSQTRQVILIEKYLDNK